MLNPDTKQAALQQFKNRWNPSPPPAPKSKRAKFNPSPVIAFIKKMGDSEFEQLKQDIQEAAAQNTLAKFGEILLRKNPAIEKWEIWSGRSRYRALIELGINPEPFLKFVGDNKPSLLLRVIEENVKYRTWTSDKELQEFLALAETAMAKLAN